MPGIRYSPMASGVAVVAVSVPIDITTAEQLRAVLLRASSHRHVAVVVDLTQASSCDSAGLRTLVRAHRRARAEGGELRLVVPADGAVIRTLVLTGLHRLIPCFNRLDQALDLRPAARDLTDALAPPPRLAQVIASGRQAGPGGVN
ncbi:MAG TPA: STAS domain-containing protein [Streptosporangiaceae bacterium]